MRRETSLSPTSRREREPIKPRRNLRYVSVTDQLHTIDVMRKGDSEDFSAAEAFLIYLGRFKMENAQRIWRQWWSYSKLGNDRALRSTRLSRPNRYGSWEMQSNASIFWRCSPSVPVPKKTSPVSSSKKLISIQRCRRLWGSFGLTSYFTLNAIYWIMNLLCSSDRVNSVNLLSVHPKKKKNPKKQAFKVTLWSWMKFKGYRKSDASVLLSENTGEVQGLLVSLQGGWGGCAALFDCMGMCWHAT